jgi:hypothetical protein
MVGKLLAHFVSVLRSLVINTSKEVFLRIFNIMVRSAKICSSIAKDWISTLGLVSLISSRNTCEEFLQGLSAIMDEDIGRLSVVMVDLDSDESALMHVDFFHPQSFTKGSVPSSQN